MLMARKVTMVSNGNLVLGL